MPYHIAAVCENGHCASASLDTTSFRQHYCERCGAKILTQCPHCLTPIKGKFYTPKFADLTAFPVPVYCYFCGKPFPWTQAALDATKAIVEEDDVLTPSEQTDLVDVLPDIITETPRTSLAAARMKKALRTAGRFTADALRQFALDFACELAKQQLGI